MFATQTTKEQITQGSKQFMLPTDFNVSALTPPGY